MAAIWDHTVLVLPATRQWWESRLYPHLLLPAEAGTRFSDPGRCKAELRLHRPGSRSPGTCTRDLSVATPMPYRSATTQQWFWESFW